VRRPKITLTRRELTPLSLAVFLLALSFISPAAINQVLAKAKGAPSGAAPVQGMMLGFSPYPPMIHPVRIGITNKAPVVRVAVWQPGAVFVGGRPIFALKPGMVYGITPGKVTELATGSSMALPYGERAYVSAPDYRVWTANRWYRGCVEIINMPGYVTAVNLLDMEEYLLGVVPSEMPSSWHLEALKSQAVAARSYAYAHVGPGSKWKSDGFDMVPDVRDQAYKGLAAEANSTFHAVHQTRGLILKDSGKVKPGFYRATVGDNEFENLNIRKSTISQTNLERVTGVKNIVGVTVRQWDATGNAVRVAIMGTKEAKEVYGIALAKMLNFATAGILDVHEEGPNWVFTCRGPGNGARGLSQHGANKLAKGGWRFDQILQQYYQDPDGKLRLEFVHGYHGVAAYHPMSGPKPVKKASTVNYTKGPLIEHDGPKAKPADGKEGDKEDEKDKNSTPPVKDDTNFSP